MGVYVAFLRGINLGPTNKIRMPELRKMAEDLGYANVATYINGGNRERSRRAVLVQETSNLTAEEGRGEI